MWQLEAFMVSSVICHLQKALMWQCYGRKEMCNNIVDFQQQKF